MKNLLEVENRAKLPQMTVSNKVEIGEFVVFLHVQLRSFTTQLLPPLAGDKSCVVNERSCTTSEVVDKVLESYLIPPECKSTISGNLCFYLYKTNLTNF